METVIIHPKNKEQLTAIKAFAKSLKIKLETNKSPYIPGFIAKINESKRQVEQGSFISLTPPNQYGKI